MAFKNVEIDGIGTVQLVKRRQNKSLRISISPDGAVRVSLPSWLPYASASAYAKTKQDWIAKHRPSEFMIVSGTRVGKSHRIVFEPSNASRVTTKIQSNQLLIHYPGNLTTESAVVQQATRRAAIKLLRSQAEILLLPRLNQLAQKHNFSYKSAQIKRLSSRWGSCDSHGNITLNCYLLQLPWHLIDYVILHELVHTKVLAHGRQFWDELTNYVSNLPLKRKEMKQRRPSIHY